MDKTAIIAIVAVSVLAVSGVALYAVNSSHNSSTTVDDSDGATTMTEDETNKYWTEMVTKLNTDGKSIKIGTATITLYNNKNPGPLFDTPSQTNIRKNTTELSYQNGYIIITNTVKTPAGNYTSSRSVYSDGGYTHIYKYSSYTTSVTQDWYRITTVNTIVYEKTVNGQNATVTLHL